MKKLIFLILASFMLLTCGSYRQSIAWKHIGTDGIMIETLDSMITIDGFYKICEKDTLSTNLKKWVKTFYYDYDEKLITQWGYIKDTDTNKIYVLTQYECDTLYNINIRKIIPENTK